MEFLNGCRKMADSVLIGGRSLKEAVKVVRVSVRGTVLRIEG